MKKLLGLILTACLILALLGCNHNQDDINEPVHFYYKNPSVAYNDEHAVIIYEIRDRADFEDDLETILNIYLQGPLTDAYLNPFPTGIIVNTVEMSEDTVCVTLSEELLKVEGMEQTIACACLTKTAMELTGCTSILITVPSGVKDGFSITMDAQSLLLLDNAHPDAE